MIELAFATCFIESPFNCRSRVLTFEVERVSLFQCMAYGQMELAKWSQDHPKWRIAKWTCRPAKMVAKI